MAWLKAVVLAAMCTTACSGVATKDVADCDSTCRAAKGWPEPTKRVPPKYPSEAARQRLEGCVVVSFEITPDGLADKYQVLDSKPAGVFDAATLASLNHWRFEVPSRPGRYAQRIDYRMDPRPSVLPLECIEQPGFDQLNGAKS